MQTSRCAASRTRTSTSPASRRCTTSFFCPVTWTIIQHDGPNHLGLWPSEHQVALITPQVHKLMKGDTASIAPCSICLCEPKEGGTIVTQCCHIFCKECLLNLIDSAAASRVPGQAAAAP